MWIVFTLKTLSYSIYLEINISNEFPFISLFSICHYPVCFLSTHVIIYVVFDLVIRETSLWLKDHCFDPSNSKFVYPSSAQSHVLSVFFMKTLNPYLCTLHKCQNHKYAAKIYSSFQLRAEFGVRKCNWRDLRAYIKYICGGDTLCFKCFLCMSLMILFHFVFFSPWALSRKGLA